MIKLAQIKVRGSVLSIAVMLAVLISLLSAFMLLRAELNSAVNSVYDTREKLVRNSRSGIEWVLASISQPGDYVSKIDLYGEGNDSVEVSRKNWGGFEVITSRAFSGRKQITKCALVGQVPVYDTNRISLFLCDLDKPLMVCGNTRLEGLLKLPAAGIKRAYIEGQNYTGDRLMYGTKLPGARNLPAFNKTLIENIKPYFLFNFKPLDSIVSLESFAFPDTLINEFDCKTLILYSNSPVSLNTKLIKGNIIICAPIINIVSNCVPEDILLFAKEIRLNDNVSGRFQAFASEKLSTGKNCKLYYPSVLSCIPQLQKETDNECILIGENTEITGTVFCFDEKQNYQTELLLHINKNVIVNGEVYINGLLDLKGNVYGSVYCHRFMLHTPSSTYENHLLNIEINARKLSRYYTGINLFSISNKPAIVRWI